MARQAPQITALIGGKRIGREEVIAKEMVRARHALRKLGCKPVEGTPVEIRQALLDRKLELGRDQLKAMLATETRRAARVATAMAVTSRGRRHPSGIQITATGITGKAFVEWFHHRVQADDEPALLAGHPEHYVIHNTAPGQEVYETNGGSPFVAAFAIDFASSDAISIPTRPDHPYRIAGVAVLPNGRTIGGAKHQFRDDGTGLHAPLGIDFPLITPPTIWYGHRWHLAIEFSNWIEAAAATGA